MEKTKKLTQFAEHPSIYLTELLQQNFPSVSGTALIERKLQAPLFIEIWQQTGRFIWDEIENHSG